MGSIALTNDTLDKYFGYLRKLDTDSKKRLIIRLTESIDTPKDQTFNLNDIYGAWDDLKDSNEIIDEIKQSRIECTDREEL